MNMQAVRDRYRAELYENVIPFWEEHCVDKEYGGYFTSLDRDGSVYDTEKYMWMQWRIVYMFAKFSIAQGGNELRLEFDWAHGLHNANGPDDELDGFEVADWSRRLFYPAKARIDGEAVILSSDKVAFPRHARYNWKCCPKTHIVNEAGLPMLTFNTSKQ